MALLERHLGFVESLRAAGLPVSLAEGLDAVTALGTVGWGDRETVREVYAATLVKRHSQRVTFDEVFDLWFPRMVGEGVRAGEYADHRGMLDTPAQLAELRDRITAALEAELEAHLLGAELELDVREGEAAGRGQGDGVSLAAGGGAGRSMTLEMLAAEAMRRFGKMPGRQPGQTGWSAYNTMRRVGREEVVRRLVEALTGKGVPMAEARAEAEKQVEKFDGLVQADALRRVAAEKDPGDLALSTVRPTIDRLDFSAARRADIDEMRRELLPLARRLAVRLTQEAHSRRRGPLDFRRTVRASVSTGGVPLETYHRPRRPHRTDLVVLCDVSGSVASFAQFTLLLVFALREQFTGVRAFTFVDDVHEVTDVFRPGADPADVLSELAARSAHAARFGRTNYGVAFSSFAQKYGDAVGPRATLLVLGDARSNYADLNERLLAEIAGQCKQAFWLNPEHRRHWGGGDSAAPTYGAVVPMTECRNLTQLAEFVHDLV